MANWNIKVLDYGRIDVPKEAVTLGVDVGKMLTLPYLGFLLSDGSHKVLVDCGIHERIIVDGKAWGNFPAKGGVS